MRPLGAGAGRAPVPGDGRRGRRPARDEQATGNALLKAIEEPDPEDRLAAVRPHRRGRAAHDPLAVPRQVSLATPTARQVTAFLAERHGVPEPVAAFAARASQGHIGRARALASDETTRNRRREVVRLPARLTSLGACMNAAANLVDIAKDEAAALTES